MRENELDSLLDKWSADLQSKLEADRRLAAKAAAKASRKAANAAKKAKMARDKANLNESRIDRLEHRVDRLHESKSQAVLPQYLISAEETLALQNALLNLLLFLGLLGAAMVAIVFFLEPVIRSVMQEI